MIKPTSGDWIVLTYQTTGKKSQTRTLISSNQHHICSLDVTNRQEGTLEADAQLIAQAPKMYEACRLLLAFEESMDGNEDGNDEGYWAAVKAAREVVHRSEVK